MKPASGRPADPLPHARAGVDEAADESPPLFGSWGVLYGIVIAELIAMILLCAWITRQNA